MGNPVVGRSEEGEASPAPCLGEQPVIETAHSSKANGRTTRIFAALITPPSSPA
jgi:hypothetical protein